MRRLWYNGKVVSMDGAMTRYEAVGAEDDKIVFLGTSADALAQSWDEKKDLQGAMVLPGFNDTHLHMLYYAMFQKNVALFGVDSIETIVERCRERIEKNHPDYLLGMGWNQETMKEGRMPTREDMDRISTEIPVCMLRTCAHIAACNTVMLERIRELKNVDPETISHVDFINGLLREDAMRLYMDVIPKADDAYVRELIEIGQRDLNAAGITCVHSDDLKVIAGVDPIHLIDLFREMEEEGKLTVRVYEQCLVDQPDFGRLLAARSDPDDRTSLFRTGPRKLLQDGSLGAKSAEMIDGYVDDRSNHGIPIYTEEELCAWIKAAHDQPGGQPLAGSPPRHCPRPDHIPGPAAADEGHGPAGLYPAHLHRRGHEHHRGAGGGTPRQRLLQLEEYGGSGHPGQRRLRLPGGALRRAGQHARRHHPQKPGGYQGLPAGAGPQRGAGGASLHLRCGLAQPGRDRPRYSGERKTGGPGGAGSGFVCH